MTSITAALPRSWPPWPPRSSLSACSSPASGRPHRPATAARRRRSSPAQPAGFNADDVAFATNMIPHHQQAVELSALVPDRSTNPELIAAGPADRGRPGTRDRHHEGLPGAVEREPGQPTPAVGTAATDTDAGHGRRGHHGAAESLNGAEFDKLWLESMIGHHQGAIEMAQGRNRQRRECRRQAPGQEHRQYAAGRDRSDEADAGSG